MLTVDTTGLTTKKEGGRRKKERRKEKEEEGKKAKQGELENAGNTRLQRYE